MAAALECWSGRPSTDEDVVEQVLMKTHDRSEAFPYSSSSSTSAPSSPSSPTAGPLPPKKWHRLGRNVAGALSALKNSLNLDALRDQMASARFAGANAGAASDKLLWGGVVRDLSKLYPGSQLPEKLIASVRRHFDSLPNSYAQAGHDVKDVLLHVRLIEEASNDDHPAVDIQEVQDFAGADGGVLFRVTFASTTPISWPSVSSALDNSSITCKKIQIFEKKGLTLGIVMLLANSGTEKLFKARVDAAVRSAVRKPRNGGVKLHFGLCGCQEENAGSHDYDGNSDDDDDEWDSDIPPRTQLPKPLPEASLVVAIDEWQAIRSGKGEIGRWILNPHQLELIDRTGPNSFKGVYKGKKVWIKKLKGCDRGSSYEIEVKRNLMQLMSCRHRNILKLHGLCADENQGMCLVTKMMEGGSVHEAIMQKSKRLGVKEVLKISLDVAEGLMFMNDHGVAYKDLNTLRILLDRQGNACLGDMGVVNASKNAGEVMEYETAGYRWLAPEIIAGDPETVTETWMSNVYSFGMVVWEMVAGETAYSSYSPVQAAVGIASCGLRPEIPRDCPPFLKSLMMKCWSNCPAKRPKFSEIVSILLRQITR